MKAALLYKPYDIRIEDIEIPRFSPQEVLVKVGATGICGTDILVFKGKYHVTYPIILGHEFSGTVVKVGEKVNNFRPGEKIVVRGGMTCGNCYFCKTGMSNLCQNQLSFGRSVNGCLAEYVALPSKLLYKIPDNIELIEAQSVQTLAAAVHAVNRGRIGITDTVAILGPGHAGLLLVQVAKAAGASEVILTGTRDNRLKLGEKLGADHIINALESNPVEIIRSLTGGLGADVVIDAAGTKTSVNQAIEVVRAGGTIVFFGISTEPLDNFEIFKIYSKELNIVGSRASSPERLEFEKAIRLLSSGKVKVRPLITHVFPLEETQKAFEIAEKRLENVIRVVIVSSDVQNK